MPGSLRLDAVLAAAGAHWQTTIGLTALGVLLYWYFAARRDSEPGAANTSAAFMDRAEAGFGGLFGSLTSVLIGLLAIGVTVLSQLGRLVAEVNALAGDAPFLLGHLVWGVVSWLGIAGHIPLEPRAAGWILIGITALAVVAKFTSASNDWGEVIDNARHR